MSGRNNRIVRNRERESKTTLWKTNNTPIAVVGSIFFFILILIIIVFVRKNQNAKKVVCYSYGDIKYEYFLLYSNEKVGVIDKKGNQIIEAKYSTVYIPNPEKDVFVCYEDDSQYEILNKKGEKLFSNYEEVLAIPTANEAGEMEKHVLKYKKNQLYGLVDLEGNALTEAIYDEISSLKDKPGSLLVKQNNQYGILDAKGNTIIETNYDGISADRLFIRKRFV